MNVQLRKDNSYLSHKSNEPSDSNVFSTYFTTYLGIIFISFSSYLAYIWRNTLSGNNYFSYDFREREKNQRVKA